MENKNAKAATICTRKKVLILGNRVGVQNGETGGGSIFRATMLKALSLKYKTEVLTISDSSKAVAEDEDNPDYIIGSRGPTMAMTWKNFKLFARKAVEADLIIQSGSWTPMTVWCCFVALVMRTPTLTFLTMNSIEAVNSNFRGLFWLLSLIIYVASDYLNSFLSTGAWTRSAEHVSTLRNMFFPIRGFVYLDDQYHVFLQEDTKESIEETRRYLAPYHCGSKLPIMLYVGRIIKEKRIELLIKNKPKDCILVIVGSGTLSMQFAELHSPVEERIYCHVDRLVSQEELRQYYKACDILVSASNFETLGNTVHEALLCKTPAIVQNSGGYVSQVVNGVNGYLVDWADAEEVAQAFYHITVEQKARQPSTLRRSDGSMNVMDLVEEVLAENKTLSSSAKTSTTTAASTTAAFFSRVGDLLRAWLLGPIVVCYLLLAHFYCLLDRVSDRPASVDEKV